MPSRAVHAHVLDSVNCGMFYPMIIQNLDVLCSLLVLIFRLTFLSLQNIFYSIPY